MMSLLPAGERRWKRAVRPAMRMFPTWFFRTRLYRAYCNECWSCVRDPWHGTDDAR